MSAEIVAIVKFVPKPEARARVQAALDHWRAHGEADSVRELDREIEGLLASEREIGWFAPLPVGRPDRGAV